MEDGWPMDGSANGEYYIQDSQIYVYWDGEPDVYVLAENLTGYYSGNDWFANKTENTGITEENEVVAIDNVDYNNSNNESYQESYKQNRGNGSSKYVYLLFIVLAVILLIILFKSRSK